MWAVASMPDSVLDSSSTSSSSPSDAESADSVFCHSDDPSLKL